MESIVLKSVSYEVTQGVETITILKDISVAWRKGTLIGIRGVSGSGKSSLLSIVAGFQRPVRGEIWYGTAEMTSASEARWAEARLHKVGFVFQSSFLIKELSVQENVVLKRYIQGNTAELTAEAHELLGMVGLAHKIDQSPEVLSGGEQQRVALARAMCGRPEWLILDEPSAHLDEHAAQLFMHLFLEMRDTHGMGIIIATHDERLEALCDEVWVLSQGVLQRRYP